VPDVIDRFRFNGPIFLSLANLAGPAATTAFAIAAGIAVAAWARRRLSLASPQAWAWPMAAALLCAPMIYPWYLIWLTPFLVTTETMPLTIWTLSILSTYVVWQSRVPWAVPGWALLVEYGVLLGAAAWLWRKKWAGELSSSSAAPVP
jgi:hypothetical protein